MRFANPLRLQRLPGGLGRETRIGERRTKRGVLLRLRFGQLAQRRRRRRILLLPAFPPTKTCLGAHTPQAGPVFRYPYLDTRSAPAEERLGEPGAAVAVFPRHLGLKSPPGRPRHLRGRQAEVLNLTRLQRGGGKRLPEPH